MSELAALEDLADRIRQTVLRESRRAGVGHIGSSLSIADLLAALYGEVLPADGDPADRDRFVLSKGHAALALYAALELTGRLPEGTVSTYCADDTLLGVHPENDIDGVDFSTGSLGQGLSIATGAALGARLAGSARRTFVLLSDAELNEGSVWEAAMFAGQHRLASLVAIVDLNGQQAFGRTRDVLDPGDVAARWSALGWDTRDVDGHDPAALAATIGALDTREGGPHLLVAHTTFGHGVDFMEGQIPWHYLPLDEEQYRSAMTQVGGAA